MSIASFLSSLFALTPEEERRHRQLMAEYGIDEQNNTSTAAEPEHDDNVMGHLNALHHTANAVATLLSLREPFVDQGYKPPEVTGGTTDDKGYPVIHVTADNYIDAGKPIDGTTYPGDVSRAVVHKGGRNWEIRVHDFDTKPKGKK